MDFFMIGNCLMTFFMLGADDTLHKALDVLRKNNPIFEGIGVIWDTVTGDPIGNIASEISTFFTGTIMPIITAPIAFLLYSFQVGFFYLIDCVQAIFKSMAGLSVHYKDGEVKGAIDDSALPEDIVVSMIQSNVIMDVFWSVLVASVMLVFIMSIIAIVRQEFTEQGAGNSKTKIIGKAIKAIAYFAIVPIVCIGGIYISNIFLRTFDKVTSNGSYSLSRTVFYAAAQGANRLANSEERYNKLMHGDDQWKKDVRQVLGISSYAGTDFEVGDNANNVAHAIDNAFLRDLDNNIKYVNYVAINLNLSDKSVTYYARHKPQYPFVYLMNVKTDTIDNKTYMVSEELAVINDKYVSMDFSKFITFTVDENGFYTYKWNGDQLEATRTIVESVGCNPSDVKEPTFPTFDKKRLYIKTGGLDDIPMLGLFLINGVDINFTTFSITNIQLVFYFYDLFMGYNYILGYVGGFTAAMLLLSTCLGLIQRIYELVILFVISPAFISFMPLDDGKKYEGWRAQFVSRVGMAYGPVIGINLMFIVLAELQHITIFPTGGINTLFNAIVNLIFMIVGLLAVKEFSSMISGLLGQSDALKTGEGLKEGTQKMAGRIAGGTISAARTGQAITKAAYASTFGRSGKQTGARGWVNRRMGINSKKDSDEKKLGNQMKAMLNGDKSEIGGAWQQFTKSAGKGFERYLTQKGIAGATENGESFVGALPFWKTKKGRGTITERDKDKKEDKEAADAKKTKRTELDTEKEWKEEQAAKKHNILPVGEVDKATGKKKEAYTEDEQKVIDEELKSGGAGGGATGEGSAGSGGNVETFNAQVLNVGGVNGKGEAADNNINVENPDEVTVEAPPEGMDDETLNAMSAAMGNPVTVETNETNVNSDETEDDVNSAEINNEQAETQKDGEKSEEKTQDVNVKNQVGVKANDGQKVSIITESLGPLVTKLERVVDGLIDLKQGIKDQTEIIKTLSVSKKASGSFFGRLRGKWN